MTKVVNRTALATGAVFLILCGLVPKLGAIVSIMPQAVLGGAAVMMFSSIVISGIQLVTKEKMNSEEPDYRFCSAWSWLWNGSEHSNLSSDPAGGPADLRRFRNCSGGYGCDFVEYCASK